MSVRDAVLALSYRCNARCVMCSIWKVKPGPEIKPEIYRRLPAGLRDINLSGGEPFLRPDLPEIVAAVKEACPRARLTLISNGLLPEKIGQVLPLLYRLEPDLGLGFSLDGLGAVHDRVRGVPGAYRRVRRSLEFARAAGFRDVRFSFTQTRSNPGALAEVYALCRELGLELSATVAHDSALYFRTPADAAPEDGWLRRDLTGIIRQELTSFSPKRWARAYFDSGLLEFAEQGRRRLPCRAGQAVFFLDPCGQVYPCPVLNQKMGSLAEASFDELWQSPAAAEARRQVVKCEQGCWMVCTVRSAMYRHPAKVLGWIARHKLQSHLGLDPVGASPAGKRGGTAPLDEEDL